MDNDAETVRNIISCGWTGYTSKLHKIGISPRYAKKMDIESISEKFSSKTGWKSESTRRATEVFVEGLLGKFTAHLGWKTTQMSDGQMEYTERMSEQKTLRFIEKNENVSLEDEATEDLY